MKRETKKTPRSAATGTAAETEGCAPPVEGPASSAPPAVLEDIDDLLDENRNDLCSNGHPYTIENTGWVKTALGTKPPTRRCRECARIQTRLYRQRVGPEMDRHLHRTYSAALTQLKNRHQKEFDSLLRELRGLS